MEKDLDIPQNQTIEIMFEEIDHWSYLNIIAGHSESRTTIPKLIFHPELFLLSVTFPHRAVSILMFACSVKCHLPSVTYVSVYHSLYDTFAQNESLRL